LKGESDVEAVYLVVTVDGKFETIAGALLGTEGGLGETVIEFHVAYDAERRAERNVMHGVVEGERHVPGRCRRVGCTTKDVVAVSLESAHGCEGRGGGGSRATETVMEADGVTENAGARVETDGERIPFAGDMNIDGGFDRIKFGWVEDGGYEGGRGIYLGVE